MLYLLDKTFWLDVYLIRYEDLLLDVYLIRYEDLILDVF